MGHPRAQQRILEAAREVVGAIEDGHAVPGDALAVPPLDLGDDPLDLGFVIAKCENFDGLATGAGGAKGLAEAPAIMRDHRVGGVQDVTSRAEILLEFDLHGAREVLVKVTARIRRAGIPRSAMRRATPAVKVLVLPVPAPASTSTAPRRAVGGVENCWSAMRACAQESALSADRPGQRHGPRRHGGRLAVTTACAAACSCGRSRSHRRTLLRETSRPGDHYDIGGDS